MNFSEFVSGYRSGTLSVHVDPEEAMRVCGNSPALPRHYRAAHLAGKNSARLLIFGGVIALFWIPWWIGLGASVLGLLILPVVQKLAASFVLRYSLEDESFFRQMQDAGVLATEEK